MQYLGNDVFLCYVALWIHNIDAICKSIFYFSDLNYHYRHIIRSDQLILVHESEYKYLAVSSSIVFHSCFFQVLAPRFLVSFGFVHRAAHSALSLVHSTYERERCSASKRKRTLHAISRIYQLMCTS